MTHPLDHFSLLSDEQWEELGRLLDTSADQVKNDYINALKVHMANPVPATLRKVDPPQAYASASTDEFTHSFDLTIVPGVLQLRLDVHASTGENWSAGIKVTALVFGKNVGESQVELSALNSYIDIHPSILLAKADLKIGLFGDRLCFSVEGQACYWAFGWHCTPIDARDLFCLR